VASRSQGPQCPKLTNKAADWTLPQRWKIPGRRWNTCPQSDTPLTLSGSIWHGDCKTPAHEPGTSIVSRARTWTRSRTRTRKLNRSRNRNWGCVARWRPGVAGIGEGVGGEGRSRAQRGKPAGSNRKERECKLAGSSCGVGAGSCCTRRKRGGADFGGGTSCCRTGKRFGKRFFEQRGESLIFAGQERKSCHQRSARSTRARHKEEDRCERGVAGGSGAGDRFHCSRACG
jgi:hypothetical protein